jgi:hypothetical protein
VQTSRPAVVDPSRSARTRPRSTNDRPRLEGPAHGITPASVSNPSARAQSAGPNRSRQAVEALLGASVRAGRFELPLLAEPGPKPSGRGPSGVGASVQTAPEQALPDPASGRHDRPSRPVRSSSVSNPLAIRTGRRGKTRPRPRFRLRVAGRQREPTPSVLRFGLSAASLLESSLSQARPWAVGRTR